MPLDQTPPVTESDRMAALNRLNLMDSPAEERFDRITRAAKEMFGVPGAAVTLLDTERLFVKSPRDLSGRFVPREETFCDVAISSPDICVVPDATADVRFAELPDVAGPTGIRFYAGRPLNAEPGTRVGTLCLYDVRTRELSADELRRLDELGAWAEAELQDSADRDRARIVQEAMLPAEAEMLGHEIAGLFLPKDEVGGDFYSWRQQGMNLSLVMADVMGKGTAAALMAATVRSAIHSIDSEDPGEAMGIAGSRLGGDLEQTATFATAFFATVDTTSGTLRYADAGHGLSLILSPDGSHRRLHGTGLPLGLGESDSWQTCTDVLLPGQMLAIFTDGVLDLYDGSLEALAKVAAAIAGMAPTAAVDALRALHADSVPDDDLSAIFVRRLPETTSLP